MKQVIILAAALTLGAAAIWMGGLNQDEGWYLYAANLVSEGCVPYRDFFYTQGPLMPIVYSAAVSIWQNYGLLGARVFTLLLGFIAIAFFALVAYRSSESREQGRMAAWITIALLSTNLYHLYYVAIPKTYALASLFVALGFYLLTFKKSLTTFVAALALSFASGTRISLGFLLAVVGFYLLFSRKWRLTLIFALGGFIGLGLIYGPFLLDDRAFAGLIAAQKYHAARGGFDLVWTVGSFSRLVRWYLPIFFFLPLIFIVKRERFALRCRLPLWGFLAVFVVQMLAPFPYEDYQVPIMGLLTIFVAVNAPIKSLLPVIIITFATSFGSPLLEKWSVNGQDRFWSLKKNAYELPQLREVAKLIEAEDPGGKELLTQDLYLAIETNRKVPEGLEMGPFAILSDEKWRELLTTCECPVAALSGYTFAIEPPVCNERSIDRQLEYWKLLKSRYTLVAREESFGQNSTTLLILKRGER